jgi:cytoskeletal protein RodZ
MNTYSPNPQSISQASMTNRSGLLLKLCVFIVIVILIGLILWFIETRQASVVPQKTQTELRAEVATMLQSSQPASAAKISSVSSLLSNSKTAASAEERQSVANMLSK